MIVRNEADNLRDCLAPVASLFDEIVIVDTGSTDDTREVAREFTPLVHEFPWNDDFSAARNESVRRSTGDWIFWLDADDRVPAQELGKLKTLLGELDHRLVIYTMTTASQFEYEADGVQHLSHGRLVRKSPGLAWKGRVHEQLDTPARLAGYEVVPTDIQIAHFGYSVAANKLKKMQRDIRLLSMDFAADPEDVGTVYHLALAFARFGNYTEARKYLSILERRSPEDSHWGPRLYELLAMFSEQSGDLRQALNYAEKGSIQYPGSVTLLYELADKCHKLGEKERSLEAIRRIRELPDVPAAFSSGSMGEIRERWVPLLEIDVLVDLGRVEEALGRVETLALQRPGDTRVVYMLGSLCYQCGQRDRVPDIRARLETLPQGGIFSLLLHVEERMHAGELEGLSESIDCLISMCPTLPRARLLRVEYLFRTGSLVHDYLAACRDVLRACPNHTIVAAHVSQIEEFLKNRSQLPPAGG